MKAVKLNPNTGSFRDPENRVYETKFDIQGSTCTRIFRGLNHSGLINYKELSEKKFFTKLIDSGKVIATHLVDNEDVNAKSILEDGWMGVVEHEAIPFISYPYEWSFSMLKDAALLQTGVA